MSPTLCEVILNDLFGRPSEEREVREIAIKTLEVKHPKALDIVELLSSFVSPVAVSGLLGPVVGKLHSASGAQVERVRDVLKRLSQGVLRNRAMTSQKLLLFLHQQLTASLSKVSGVGISEEETPSKGSKYLGEVRRDCYLIQERVERGGLKPQVREAANIQVLTEFCLGLLSSALRVDRKVDLRQQSVQEMLDPFIETLSRLLPTPHLRICTLSVRIPRTGVAPPPAQSQAAHAAPEGTAVLLPRTVRTDAAGRGLCRQRDGEHLLQGADQSAQARRECEFLEGGGADTPGVR